MRGIILMRAYICLHETVMYIAIAVVVSRSRQSTDYKILSGQQAAPHNESDARDSSDS